ncbi:MAG TPA: barstar family protein [Streptosporangiaceae bacterium]
MRSEDHAAWEREFPVRYLLVQEDDDGEEQLHARCAGVEGLFADPVPFPREILTLRGCTPEGMLREAVTRPGATQLLGEVGVEISDDQRPAQWWTLADTVVIAHQPSRADLALTDITVAAVVKQDDDGELPASPQFELFAGHDTVGRCLRVDGLFTSCGPPPIPVQLIGCEPAEPLAAAMRGPQEWYQHYTRLWALDRAGRMMESVPVGGDILYVRPSVLGGTLIDLTLADAWYHPPLAARPVWEAWYQGVPSALNQWAPYSAQGREAWHGLAFHNTTATRGADRSGGVYHLDGRYLTDVPGLHCAIGEAFNGPGGYYGREWQGLNDCLGGGFGAVPPFTLIWHDAAVARQALADVYGDLEGKLPYVDDLIQLLERYGVTVDLR